MIEAILAILAVVAYFGGVATKDFIRPALPQRKQAAIASTKKNPFTGDTRYIPLWSRTANNSPNCGHNLHMKWHYGYNDRPDIWLLGMDYEESDAYKIARRLERLYTFSTDLTIRAMAETMFINHLFSAYETAMNSAGSGEAKIQFGEHCKLIDANVKILESQSTSVVKVNQDAITNHLLAVNKALNPPAIDENLDLSTSPTGIISNKIPASGVSIAAGKELAAARQRQTSIELKAGSTKSVTSLNQSVSINYDQACRIKKLSNEGFPIYALAADYGTTRRMIEKVLRILDSGAAFSELKVTSNRLDNAIWRE